MNRYIHAPGQTNGMTPMDPASLAPSKPPAIPQDEGTHHQQTEAVDISPLIPRVTTHHATPEGSRHRMVQYPGQLIICVMGKEFTLRTPSNDQLQRATHLAAAYANCLFRGTAHTEFVIRGNVPNTVPVLGTFFCVVLGTLFSTLENMNFWYYPY